MQWAPVGAPTGIQPGVESLLHIALSSTWLGLHAFRRLGTWSVAVHEVCLQQYPRPCSLVPLEHGMTAA